MVYYFTSRHEDEPAATIYMGKHKEESELGSLIKYGWETDVWFHVDNLSSAHVYLRLPDPGDGTPVDWEHIAPHVLADCAQLTKANSIEGNKKDNITVIYTPWSNLMKTGDMQTGQVGFHKPKMVKKIFVPKRENAIVNRLKKTCSERYPDLAAEQAEHDRQVRLSIKRKQWEKREVEEQAKREQLAAADAKRRGYADLFTPEAMEEAAPYDEDDFM